MLNIPLFQRDYNMNTLLYRNFQLTNKKADKNLKLVKKTTTKAMESAENDYLPNLPIILNLEILIL